MTNISNFIDLKDNFYNKNNQNNSKDSIDSIDSNEILKYSKTKITNLYSVSNNDNKKDFLKSNFLIFKTLLDIYYILSV